MVDPEKNACENFFYYTPTHRILTKTLDIAEIIEPTIGLQEKINLSQLERESMPTRQGGMICDLFPIAISG
jgi:hypothetical protein